MIIIDSDDWLIIWCLMLFSTLFHLYHNSQSTYSCFPGVLLTSIQHNIPCKPMAPFPHNHCWNNGQWSEGKEFSRNDYHRSSEGILAEPWIEPVTFCSQVPYATDWATRLGQKKFEIGIKGTQMIQKPFGSAHGQGMTQRLTPIGGRIHQPFFRTFFVLFSRIFYV